MRRNDNNRFGRHLNILQSIKCGGSLLLRGDYELVAYFHFNNKNLGR